MDFKHQITAPAGVADIGVDALVLVVGERADAGLAAPLATLITDAVSEGDLVLMKGKLLYLHRPAGVAARRFAGRSGSRPVRARRAALARGDQAVGERRRWTARAA